MEVKNNPNERGSQMEKELKQGDHMVSIHEADTDYGFTYVEDAPGIPGMIHLRNRSGLICVAARAWKKKEK